MFLNKVFAKITLQKIRLDIKAGRIRKFGKFFTKKRNRKSKQVVIAYIFTPYIMITLKWFFWKDNWTKVQF